MPCHAMHTVACFIHACILYVLGLGLLRVHACRGREMIGTSRMEVLHRQREWSTASHDELRWHMGPT